MQTPWAGECGVSTRCNWRGVARAVGQSVAWRGGDGAWRCVAVRGGAWWCVAVRDGGAWRWRGGGGGVAVAVAWCRGGVAWCRGTFLRAAVRRALSSTCPCSLASWIFLLSSDCEIASAGELRGEVGGEVR